ncbi:hypothetical protein BGP77_11485 [Saccharospirillum sp. MSK14-1]|nr:hypothetical protein BGP77_11485 [Saccharospirillum sp. MSK14-1]
MSVTFPLQTFIDGIKKKAGMVSDTTKSSLALVKFNTVARLIGKVLMFKTLTVMALEIIQIPLASV